MVKSVPQLRRRAAEEKRRIVEEALEPAALKILMLTQHEQLLRKDQQFSTHREQLAPCASKIEHLELPLAKLRLDEQGATPAITSSIQFEHSLGKP